MGIFPFRMIKEYPFNTLVQFKRIFVYGIHISLFYFIAAEEKVQVFLERGELFRR